jgi:hypothetical protein
VVVEQGGTVSDILRQMCTVGKMGSQEEARGWRPGGKARPWLVRVVGIDRTGGMEEHFWRETF